MPAGTAAVAGAFYVQPDLPQFVARHADPDFQSVLVNRMVHRAIDALDQVLAFDAILAGAEDREQVELHAREAHTLAVVDHGAAAPIGRDCVVGIERALATGAQVDLRRGKIRLVACVEYCEAGHLFAARWHMIIRHGAGEQPGGQAAGEMCEEPVPDHLFLPFPLSLALVFPPAFSVARSNSL